MRRLTRKLGLPKVPKGLRVPKMPKMPEMASIASLPSMPSMPSLNGLAGGDDRLVEFEGTFRNPGKLRALYHVPEGLKPGAALVVVLHGCTQNAAGYDRGSGWSRLADKHGFAVLFPEQARGNNANLCFNWYEAGDSRRGRGEAASIDAMARAMTAAHHLDPGKVFVTGLSAGGAMASVMLAAYPETFAAGAIIAGLPYGCADGLTEAFSCMAGRGDTNDKELGARVRTASPHKGRFPRISVWHGSADRTVSPDNADSIVRQWAAVHGLDPTPGRSGTVDGYPHDEWLGADGETLIERYLVTGMGHGTPLMPGAGEGKSGEAMPHMLDVGLSSTDRIAAFFGIAPEPAAAMARAAKPAAAAAAVPAKAAAAPKRARGAAQTRAAPAAGTGTTGVQKVIEDALKAAGLMR
jgi:poly(hydroxyalkanoate) depolymerase family esterase